MIKLPSGRKLYATRGLVSINEDLEIAEGYDGHLPLIDRPEWMDDDDWADCEKLSALEQIELANRMLQLWSKFRDRAAQRTA